MTADAFTLTPAEVRTAHRCARVMVQFHDRAGKPVSAEIAAHYERLDHEVRSLTRSRQGDDENDSDRGQLNVIGTARVAELGGWKVDDIGYLFSEDKVIQYAEAKNGRRSSLFLSVRRTNNELVCRPCALSQKIVRPQPWRAALPNPKVRVHKMPGGISRPPATRPAASRGRIST